jgi:protein TonB
LLLSDSNPPAPLEGGALHAPTGDVRRAACALACSLALHAAAFAALVGLATSVRVDVRAGTPLRVIPVALLAEPAPAAVEPPLPAAAPTPAVAAAPPKRPSARPARRPPEPVAVSAAPSAPVPAVAPEAAPGATAPSPLSVAAVPVPNAAPTPTLRGGYQRRPTYPHRARLRGAEGTTLLRVWVESSGRVGAVELERSAGDGDLDAAAAKAVRDWRFEPLHASHDPSGLWVLVPVEFHLR